MSFYKVSGEDLQVAPNSVHAPDYTLLAETHLANTYPVDGWYWFDTLQEAMTQLVRVPIAGVPQVISKRQGRAQLKAEGLLTSVEAYMVSLATDDLTRMAYEDATEWRRTDPNVLAMMTMLGKTAADADAFFTAAAVL